MQPGQAQNVTVSAAIPGTASGRTSWVGRAQVRRCRPVVYLAWTYSRHPAPSGIPTAPAIAAESTCGVGAHTARRKCPGSPLSGLGALIREYVQVV